MAATWRLAPQYGSGDSLDDGRAPGRGPVGPVIMAHEIGHLLLPPDSHASGIMAPKVDLFLIEHGGLFFDPRRVSTIRARIGPMPRSEQGTCGA